MNAKALCLETQGVRLVLGGRKTQVRTVVRNKSLRYDSLVLVSHDEGQNFWPYASDDDESELCSDGNERPLISPYGKVGGTLWVQEAFRLLDSFDGDSMARVSDRCLDAGYSTPWAPVQFEEDGSRRDWKDVGTPTFPLKELKAGKLRSPAHMPLWASRILLSVTSVGAQRLHDITDAQCVAEGVSGGHGSIPGYAYSATPREHYQHLWSLKHGTAAWNSNPWTWVATFDRVRP